MITRFNIPANELLAMNEIAPDADIRHYLNSVFVDVTPKAVTLVATDGHILGILNATATEITCDQPVSFILPIREVLPLLKHRSVDLVSFEFTDGNIEVQTILGKTTVEPIDGKYPDYKRVLPKKPTQQGYFAVDASLLAVFTKVAKHLSLKNCGINLRFYGKNSPAGVTFSLSEQFYGVVMPMQYEVTDRPAWLESA